MKDFKERLQYDPFFFKPTKAFKNDFNPQFTI